MILPGQKSNAVLRGTEPAPKPSHPGMTTEDLGRLWADMARKEGHMRLLPKQAQGIKDPTKYAPFIEAVEALQPCTTAEVAAHLGLKRQHTGNTLTRLALGGFITRGGSNRVALWEAST